MEPKKRAKYIAIDRTQGRFGTLWVEDLIGAEHPARMIWELVGRLDLGGFEEEVASFEAEAGRPRWSPRLLVSVLAYGYTLGTGSARQLERQMEYEPGLRWLTGMESINHHTLSDFRRQDLKKLEDVLAQVLALLASEKLVDFTTLLQDGTKMRARSSSSSRHRRKTIDQHLAEARACVAELDRQAAAESSGESGKRTKQEAARARAARERLQRMQAASAQLARKEAAAPRKKKEEVRVSETEPEAEKMKHPQGGSYWPSYNLQIVTEGLHGFGVSWTVSTAHNDQQELVPGLTKAQSCTGQPVKQMIVDAGYAQRDNLEAMKEAAVVLVAPRLSEKQRQAGPQARAGIAPEFAPWKFTRVADGQTLICPAGETLVQIGQVQRHGLPKLRYQADAAVCGACAHKAQCSPQQPARRVEQVIESAAVQEHDERMLDPAMQALYAQRKELAEYPQLRIKSNWRLDRFRLSGLAAVTKEAFWMVLAFTLDRLHFVRRRQALATA